MNFTTKDTLLENLDINLTLLDKTKVIATMPVSSKTKQIAGILHGGASAALLETVASIGSCLNINMQKQEAFGIELNISHLNAVSDDYVEATATPIRLGRSLHVWNVDIFSKKNPKIKVATGRCSVYVRNKK